MMLDRTRLAASVLAAGLAAAPASAQTLPTDPGFTFDTVYNIGTVPAGSPFDIATGDIPGVTVATGSQVGDGDSIFGEAFVTPAFLGGDTLRSDSQLNVFDGGEILRVFSAGPFNGTGSNIEVNISGGSVGFGFFANRGSTVNLSSGSIGDSFTAVDGSTINISGGSVGNSFLANGGTVNISGGSFGGTFIASRNRVNLFGTSFFLGGVELADLELGEAFTITDRDVTLTGVLADGSAFDFELNGATVPGEDRFINGAVLTVTLVADSEPCSPADLAEPLGVLDGADITEAVSLIQSGEAAGDFNGDGLNNVFDLLAYLEDFGAGCP